MGLWAQKALQGLGQIYRKLLSRLDPVFVFIRGIQKYLNSWSVDIVIPIRNIVYC